MQRPRGRHIFGAFTTVRETESSWEAGQRDEGGSLAKHSRGLVGSNLLCLLEAHPHARDPSLGSTDTPPFSQVKSYFCNMNKDFRIYFSITDLPLRQLKFPVINHSSASFTFFLSSPKLPVYQISSPN